jgi:shikimate dehydrogenase
MDVDALAGRGLEDLLGAARTAGFAGVNVTYPFKEAVPALLDAVAADARQIGAVNTVTIDRDGTTTGYNTDRIGFRRSFEEKFGCDAVAGKTAIMVGAGGAGRAVAFALCDLGVATLLVSDKNAAQQVSPRRSRPTSTGPLPGRDRPRVGIGDGGPPGQCHAGRDDGLSRPAGRHRHDPGPSLGSDVIYTPLETDLLKAARAKGARAMGGAGMCVHQAVEAFRLFTGFTPDVERMHAAFAKAAVLRDRMTEPAE